MRFRSIGARLTAWYTSLLTVTLLLMGGITYGLLVYSLSRDIVSSLNGVAKVMAQRARAAGTTVFPPDVEQVTFLSSTFTSLRNWNPLSIKVFSLTAVGLLTGV